MRTEQGRAMIGVTDTGPGIPQEMLPKLFEPLGYTVTATQHPLDAHSSEWGASRYFTVTLAGVQRLSDLLSHLYVLVPVLDDEKQEIPKAFVVPMPDSGFTAGAAEIARTVTESPRTPQFEQSWRPACRDRFRRTVRARRDGQPRE